MERLTIPDKKVGGGWERTVVDAYERGQGDGIIIIINGSESGKYWDKEEWDADHKGELNVQEQRGVS